MKKTCKLEVLSKIDGKWETVGVVTDELDVYQRLSRALVAKRINSCRYITRVQRTPGYDGTQTITVTFYGGIKNVFTVPESF
jgi:hypothetical protein